MTNQVAQNILSQLGGRRFIMMTGAKNLVAHKDGLSFHLPARSAKNGINHVSIKLNAMDLYDVQYSKWNARKLEMNEVARIDNAYNDMLVENFENETGLYTTL